jgi:hypothetical protein
MRKLVHYIVFYLGSLPLFVVLGVPCILAVCLSYSLFWIGRKLDRLAEAMIYYGERGVLLLERLSEGPYLRLLRAWAGLAHAVSGLPRGK